MFKLDFKKFARLPNIGNRELIGIDFSGFNLKLVYLDVSLNKIEVVNVFHQNIVGLSDQDLSRAIRSVFGGLKAKNPQIINIVPSHLVITKNIEIPSTDPREIKEIIGLQAGRHTPYSREEIIVDYIEIGTYKNSYTKILLVIVTRNIVKRQYDLMEKAGLRLDRVLLAAEGLACSASKILKLENENSPSSIVHIDDGYTDFIITLRNKPMFIRSIPIGTQHLLGDRQTYEIKFVEEIRRSLEAYQNEDIEKIPSVLILTGAIDVVGSLEANLNDVLHLPIKSTPYFKNLILSAEALKNSSTAKGMSFLSIISSLTAFEKVKVDLVPEEIKLRKELEERGRDLIKTGIFLLAIFILLFSILMSKIYFKNAYLSKLIAKYQGIAQDAQKLQVNFEKIGLVKNYLASRGYSLEVLTELYTILTPDLQISDIRYDDQGKFTIRGTAEAMSTVFSFVENMEKSKYFKDVKTKYTTKRKEESKDLTDFEIACVLTTKNE
jgi:Tfp pilus assembly PilM family ATPase